MAAGWTPYHPFERVREQNTLFRVYFMHSAFRQEFPLNEDFVFTDSIKDLDIREGRRSNSISLNITF